MALEEVLSVLRANASRRAVAGMARYGISPQNTLGVSIPFLRKMAREIGRNHTLAGQLWRSGVHEARILAAMVDDPSRVTARQMDRWARDLDSWDVCDQVCLNLFRRTSHARTKAVEWSGDQREFVKRAGFALVACLAVHDTEATDTLFQRYLAMIRRHATDERNYVRKAVNWALRQIGKRNGRLRRRAIQLAEELQDMDSKGARWVGSDAFRELSRKQPRREETK